MSKFIYSAVYRPKKTFEYKKEPRFLNANSIKNY